MSTQSEPVRLRLSLVTPGDNANLKPFHNAICYKFIDDFMEWGHKLLGLRYPEEPETRLTGNEEMIGRTGKLLVASDNGTTGTVLIDGEHWTTLLDQGKFLSPDDAVRVTPGVSDKHLV